MGESTASNKTIESGQVLKDDAPARCPCKSGVVALQMGRVLSCAKVVSQPDRTAEVTCCAGLESMMDSRGLLEWSFERWKITQHPPLRAVGETGDELSDAAGVLLVSAVVLLGRHLVA